MTLNMMAKISYGYLCSGGVNVYLYSVYIDKMSYIEYSMNLDEHSIPLTLP